MYTDAVVKLSTFDSATRYCNRVIRQTAQKGGLRMVPLAGGSKWKSQNRVGFLENRVKSKEKAHESAKNEKNGI